MERGKRAERRKRKRKGRRMRGKVEKERKEKGRGKTLWIALSGKNFLATPLVAGTCETTVICGCDQWPIVCIGDQYSYSVGLSSYLVCRCSVRLMTSPSCTYCS